MKRRLLSLTAILFLTVGYAFSQWTYVNNTGTSFILYGMSFPPGQSDIGYACGMQYTYDADGVIVKTTDGGNNWTQIWPVSGTIDGLQGIWFTSELVGYACGWNDYFIKTTDGGASWTPINTGADVWYYRDVEFWDANNGVALGVMNNAGDQAAFITSNAGVTWSPASSGLAVADVMGLSYANQNTIYGVGTSASVYKSVDGGHNWTVSSTLSAMLLGVDFANTSFAVVGGEEKIFATNNGGTNWTTYVTGYENFYGTLALPDGTGYCAGTDENIYKTTDYGQNWTMDYDGSGSSTLYRIRQTASGTIFACGSQGRIMKMSPPLDADFTATPTTVCSGEQVNFYDNSVGAVTSWSWTFEGGTPASSDLENPVVTYNAPGTYDVQLVVTSGSYNSTELKNDYITVYGALVAPDTPVGPSEICGSYSCQYSTQPVLYAESYDWQVIPASAGTITGNGITAQFLAAMNWSGSYTVKVRADNNCGEGPWSPELNGFVNFNPTLFDLMGNGSYCEGEDGSEITLSGSESGVNYELYKDNVTTGIIFPGNGNPLSFGFFTETGLYTATGITGICDESMIGQVYVHEVPLPAPVISGPALICDHEEDVYSTEEHESSLYDWTVSGGEITSGAGTHLVTILWGDPGNGSVSVTETNHYECVATSPVFSVTVDDCTGVDEIPGGKATIYPNPFHDKLNFSGLNDASVRIYNLTGIEVLYLEQVSGDQKVNTSNFKQGIYFVKLQQADKLSVMQLVKQ